MTTTSYTERRKLGQGLLKRRLALGLTRAELASRANCSTAWIQTIEGGAIPRYSPTMRRITDVLDRLERETE